MKTFFKIFSIFCLLGCFQFSADAQTVKKKLTADLHAGLNFAEMDVNNGQNEDNKLKLGAVVGVNINYKIYGNIQLQTGFYVSKKGLKQEAHSETTTALKDVYILDTVRTTVANYIQIPLAIGYEVYLTKNFAFNVNVGLYGAYGFKGTYENKYSKATIPYGGNIIYEPLQVGSGETFDLNKWKRLDYGLIGSIGFIYDIYTINLNYERGLNNITRESWSTLKNRNISILLGLRF